MKTALIVLDLINDIVHAQGKLAGGGTAAQASARDLVAKTNKVVAHARACQWPRIFVKVGFSGTYAEQPKSSPFFGKAHAIGALTLGTWGTEFVEGLDVLSSDSVVVKHRISAFSGTALETLLRPAQVEHLVLVGVSTTWAVEATAREAHDRDYRVTVVEDACAARNEDDHRHAMKNIAAIAMVTSVDSLISGRDGAS
ncbi:Isochorismatase family protein YecD [Cupriavidus yeoncheonensis]|uniref:Isochorismatase family protein YecD n=1 Tax=Cupriavidus yeoncheonensis TaxID=1462994 RepID=A0A916J1H6_9BURK|nr:isochorismatase family cysteine hydrolase [Cupriavidus yeoncheonensis]CAG2157125.1 Isochorismatase family protein YecD [Cupriavidus yeoncheonensis]